MHDSGDRWRFKHDQIALALVADYLLTGCVGSRGSYSAKLRFDEDGKRQELGKVIVDILGTRTRDEEFFKEAAKLIAELISVDSLATTPGLLAADVALAAVERTAPVSSQRIDRTRILMGLAGGPTARNLSFTTALRSFDFRGCTFERCKFAGVTFVNCQFDGSSRFRQCDFFGGNPPVKCDGFGSATMDDDCSFDQDAAAWINSIRVAEGQRKYSPDDLRNDIRSVLTKFFVRSGLNFRSVQLSNLERGGISVSPHRKAVVKALLAGVLEEHHVSGMSEPGVNVRRSAFDAVRFYAANNVFTGPLEEVFSELRREIGL